MPEEEFLRTSRTGICARSGSSILLYDGRIDSWRPVVKHTGYNFEHLQVSADARKRAVLDMTVEIVRGVDSPTRTLTLQPGIAFKPMASMFVQLSPPLRRHEDAAQ
jgi:hypothetical protein